MCRSSTFSPLSALHTFWFTVYCFMSELIKLHYNTEGHSLIKTSLTVEANCSLSPGYSWPTCHKLRRGTVGYKELRSDPQYAGQVAHQLWNVKGKAAALSTFAAEVFQMLHGINTTNLIIPICYNLIFHLLFMYTNPLNMKIVPSTTCSSRLAFCVLNLPLT